MWYETRKRIQKKKSYLSLLGEQKHGSKTTYKNKPIIKWETKNWGEIPADFGRKYKALTLTQIHD